MFNVKCSNACILIVEQNIYVNHMTVRMARYFSITTFTVWVNFRWITTTWMKWHRITGVPCYKKVPNNLKGKDYKNTVCLVVLCGAECSPDSK